MKLSIAYPVTFKHDDLVLFQTTGFLTNITSEPHNTAEILATAIRSFVNAKHAREVAEDAVRKSNIVLITDPTGAIRTLSEEEVEEIFNLSAELRKIKVTDETAIVVSVEGGFSGGDLCEPVEGIVATMTVEDRSRVEAIVDLIQTRKPKFSYDEDSFVGDFGHYVRIGDKQTSRWDKQVIFTGGFRRTPLEIEELETILKKYQVST